MCNLLFRKYLQRKAYLVLLVRNISGASLVGWLGEAIINVGAGHAFWPRQVGARGLYVMDAIIAAQ